jgi:protein-L-isoaspartate(D-aspartate) O-methyltransferase
MDVELDWAGQRAAMVEEQLAGRDIVDAHVLDAMRVVPRHRFVAAKMRSAAYADRPLTIGHGATISQPYIVAHMIALAGVRSGHRVLDVGSGCGYQAAVAAQIGATVFGIEIVPELVEQSRVVLAELGYDKVVIRQGDGHRGWPEHAPYDAILVGAAPERVPSALVDQLAPGGTLVLPVGQRYRQDIRIVRRTAEGIREEVGIPVRFVPLVDDDAV